MVQQSWVAAAKVGNVSILGLNHLGNPQVISVFCTVRSISPEAVGKTWAGTQKKQISPDCILQDSKLSLPVPPGPLSEAGLMTILLHKLFALCWHET